MRKILIGIGVLIALIGGMVIYTFSNLDSLIKEAVEKHGSEVTQANVTLNGVTLDAKAGSASLRGLKIGNPQGFTTPSAFSLGEISVQIDTDSIKIAGSGGPVTLKEIVIGAPEVTYELAANGSNIAALQNNVNAYIAKLGGAGAEPAPRKEAKEGVKLIINDLYVRQGKVNVSASILKGESLSAALPDIHLKDIGKNKGGASQGEVAEKLLTALNQSVVKAVAGIGIGNTFESLQGHLAGTAAGASKAVTEGAGDVGKKLKGLLGN